MPRFHSGAVTALMLLAGSLHTKMCSKCWVNKEIINPFSKYLACYLLEKSASGRGWDEESKTPYFNYREANQTYQVWYDDPQSLSIKYKVATDMGLGGVGFWTGNFLDYNNQSMVEAMLSIVP